MHRSKFEWLAIVFLLASVGILSVSSCSRSLDPTQRMVAMYEDCYFDHNPRFTEFSTPVPNENKIARVYIELPDQRRFLLSELPEEVASELLQPLDLPREETRYVDDYSILKYRDGKLVFAVLDWGSELFRISPNRDGPYLDFPIEREALLQAFGEPLRWRRPFHRPTGP